MKAFKPDGSRWFAPTPVEVMDRWLEDPELQDWFARMIEMTDLAEVERDFVRYVSRPVLMIGPPSVREQRSEQVHYALLRDCLDVALAALARGMVAAAEAAEGER